MRRGTAYSSRGASLLLFGKLLLGVLCQLEVTAGVAEVPSEFALLQAGLQGRGDVQVSRTTTQQAGEVEWLTSIARLMCELVAASAELTLNF